MQWNPDNRAQPKGDEGTPHREGRPILVYYHDDFLLHDPAPTYHPENPERLVTAVNSLRSIRGLTWTTPATDDARKVYEIVHDKIYIDRVYDIASAAVVPEWLDPDTYVVRGTLKALDRLAGAIKEAVEHTLEGSHTLLLGRPPGHHAGIRGPALGAPTLGFCIFNTSALAARLLSNKGKIAVIDFDLHHGNGTQEILWKDETLHIDIHQDPSTIYPGTGFPWQGGGVKGTKINILIPPGSGDDIYEDAINRALNILKDYDPDYIVVSAGFDAYINDYAGMNASSYTFQLIGYELALLEIPITIILEGGYTSGLQNGLPSFVRGLMGNQPAEGPSTRSKPWQWERYRYWLEKLREELGRFRE